MSPHGYRPSGSASVLTWAYEPTRSPPDPGELQPKLQPRIPGCHGCDARRRLTPLRARHHGPTRKRRDVSHRQLGPAIGRGQCTVDNEAAHTHRTPLPPRRRVVVPRYGRGLGWAKEQGRRRSPRGHGSRGGRNTRRLEQLATRQLATMLPPLPGVPLRTAAGMIKPFTEIVDQAAAVVPFLRGGAMPSRPGIYGETTTQSRPPAAHG